MKKVCILLFIIALLGVGVVIVFLLNQNPLVSDGFTEYNNARKQVDISLVNEGRHNLFIQEVMVNNKTPQKVQLVISYTGQLVAGGIDDDPLAKFVDISEAPIHPQLTSQEFQDAVKTKTTPIHYGIRVVGNDDIEVVSIRYKYMGITFTREINFNTWPQ